MNVSFDMKYNYSYKHLLVFLCSILVVFRFFIDPVEVLTWDVFGYYLYLPAKFIYSDLALSSQERLTNLVETYEPTSTLYQLVNVGNGSWAIKYTMGLSILYSPFFFLAHFISEPLGYPADGLSLPYQYCLTLGGLIYAMIGLVYLAKVLLHFFNQYTTSILLVLIFFGTNYFHLTIWDGTLLSHNFLFTFYALLTFFTIRWYADHKIKHAVIIGLSAGMITLVRPSEGICVLIPLLWYAGKQSYFKQKLTELKTHYAQILLAGFCFLLVLLPQALYWKAIIGEYLFYSYTNPGEGLDFLSPYTIEFLFSFRKGWFIYTPIILFSFVGFYHLYQKNKPIFYTIFIFIALDVYIASSWTTWWYAGGSFSSRSMVPAYVLLAIPMGFFIEKVKVNPSRKIAFSVVALLFIVLNLFQSWQFENKVLSKERMTWDYYWAIFGQTSVSEEDKKLLLVNRSTETFQDFENRNDYRRKPLYKNSFDEMPADSSRSENVFVLDDKHHFSPGIDIQYQDLTEFDHAWISCSVKLFIPNGYSEILPVLVATFHHKGKTYKYQAFELKIENVVWGDWNEIQFDYLTPGVRSLEDNLKVYVWHRGNQKVLLDDFMIDVYEPTK